MLHGSKEYAYAKRRRFTYNCGEFDRFVGYYLIEMADFLLASRRSDNLRLCYRNCSLTCNHRSNRPLVMENMMQYVQCYLRPYRITALFFSTPFHSLPFIFTHIANCDSIILPREPISLAFNRAIVRTIF